MTNRPDQPKSREIWLYFNDLAVTAGEMHGQALARVKSRLRGALPAKGFALLKMGIKGSVTRTQ